MELQRRSQGEIQRNSELKKKHKIARLQFTNAHQSWTIAD